MNHLDPIHVSVKNALLPVLVIAALCLLAGVPADAQQAQQSAQAPAVQNTGEAPTIKFDELEHDFGKVEQNTSVKHSFNFKNVGKGLLVIENVKAS